MNKAYLHLKIDSDDKENLDFMKSEIFPLTKVLDQKIIKIIYDFPYLKSINRNYSPFLEYLKSSNRDRFDNLVQNIKNLNFSYLSLVDNILLLLAQRKNRQ